MPSQATWVGWLCDDNLGVVGACEKGLSIKEPLASVLQSLGCSAPSRVSTCASLILPGYATTGQMPCREALHLLQPFGGS